MSILCVLHREFRIGNGGLSIDSSFVNSLFFAKKTRPKKIKDSKIKVQASIQGDLVRVSGKSRDLLQEVIALLRQPDFGIDLQFTNYRTN